MPKPLASWLHAQLVRWQLPGNAVLVHHGKTWHKFDGEAPGWAECGTWIPASMVAQRVGKGEEYPSPFATSGNWGSLCGKCFADERPLAAAVLHASANLGDPARRRLFVTKREAIGGTHVDPGDPE